MRFIYGLFKVIGNVLIFLFTLSAILPLFWMMYSSLKTNQEFSLDTLKLPSSITWENFQSAFNTGRLSDALLSSVFNTVISVPLIVFCAFVIGYFFTRFKFRGQSLAYFVLLIGMLVPLHALLVPLFVQFKALNMLDTRWTLILPYVAFNLPLAVFLFQSFIKGIPHDIEEAAYIDGSSFDRTLFYVIFPICMPMIATTAILNVLHTWNELPFALILNKSISLYTLPVWLTFFSGQFATDYTGKIAGLVITSMPTIILYLLFTKQVMNGMTAGAVKG
ncbi:carbohydrate ABC transporter permease [Paenibacillaceae bacterium]|nr:carbohydrate ABC transporter permease [Paenibacillaceae bacterium]